MKEKQTVHVVVSEKGDQRSGRKNSENPDRNQKVLSREMNIASGS